tara:strand:+ start:478 stop:750 length:273 start_codon:yes stop_codon:yes gene_type:complete
MDDVKIESLYSRIEEVLLRDFDFIRLLSHLSHLTIIDSVEYTLHRRSTNEITELEIFEAISEELRYLLSKGLTESIKEEKREQLWLRKQS